MRRIEVNGKLADVSESTIGLNWEYLNLLSPDQRFAPFSSEITFPPTPKNKSIIGHGDDVGANLTKIRDIPYVNMWIDVYKAISNGYLKVLSSDKNGYRASITGRNKVIEGLVDLGAWSKILNVADSPSWASYTAAIDELEVGTNGWILPRLLEDPITSTTFNIYHTTNGYLHELWISAAKLLESITASSLGHSFKIYEGGSIIDLDASSIYPYLQKLYTPAWNYVLDFFSPTDFYIQGKASGPRLINGKTIDYSTFAFFGGGSAWDFIKLIAQLFCAVIYVDADATGGSTGGTITFVPLNNIDSTGAINMTGRSKNRVKYHYLQGYEYENFIRFKNTDNLPKDFNLLTINAPVNPINKKELFEFKMMLPGLYYSAYAGTIFNTDPGANSELMKSPMLLYDDGTVIATTVTYGANSHAANLRVLTYFEIDQFYTALQAINQEGVMYDIDLHISMYDFLNFKPYRLLRINELGGLFYLNKITNFDPYSGRLAKCQVIKYSGLVHSLSETSMNFMEDGETKNVDVSANMAWTVEVSDAWISVDKTSGTGNDVVAITAADNSGVARTGTVTFNFSGTEIICDIIQPYGFVPSVSSQTNVTNEGGADGEVVIGATGGVAPYQYKIGAGAYGGSNTFSGLSVGSYVVTVKDDNGVEESVNVTILGPYITKSANIVVSSANGQVGGCSVDVYGSMATTATLIDTGDGTAWVAISLGATAVGDFALQATTQSMNGGAARSCIIRVSDDNGHANSEDITYTQEEAS